MESQIYQALAKAGKQYWWNQGRQYLVTRFFQHHFRKRKAGEERLRILDIGCAAGGTLSHLTRWGDVWGLDISPEAIALCRTWGIPEERLVLGDAENMNSFPDNQFDLITAVEILEHVERPGKALQEIRRVLKPGGLLIVTVPADMRLWSKRDESLEHKTRYELGALRRLVAQTGFDILKSSYANAFYYWPYRLLIAWRQRRAVQAAPQVRTDTYDVNPIINGVFTLFLKIEAEIILWRGLPWGVSAVCVASKTGKNEAAG